uniref:DNA 3'-5' helicase n=1 Tax=Anolis carolinensis TaxID=28377 RepID=A0A803TDC6_ANOCA
QASLIQASGLSKPFFYVLEQNLPFLEFPGSVIYSYNASDCSLLAEDIISMLPDGAVLGFDIEWTPVFTKGKEGKVALIQLCESEEKCYLFHISSMSNFPGGLKRLLEDNHIKKIGVGIEGDKWKLMRDFEVNLGDLVDLADLANKKLRCKEIWSLNDLVKHLFHKQLLKEKLVRCGNWEEFPLTEEQKLYAATDAYAGFLIYKKLMTMSSDKKLQISIEKGEAHPLALTYLCQHSLIRISEILSGLSENIKALRRVLLLDSACQMELGDAENSGKITRNKEKLETSELPSKLIRESNDHVDHLDHFQNDILVEDEEEPNNKNQAEDVSNERTKAAGEYGYLMSLDITEYELQMLERQAEEELLNEAACKSEVLISSVLQDRRDNLVVMATGYGKSLCFQFPPVYTGGTGIVISPLISLMEDQVLQLEMSGVQACLLGSAQSKNIRGDIKAGHYRVVYITPEFCSGNLTWLEELDQTIGLIFLILCVRMCVDILCFPIYYCPLGFTPFSLQVPIIALTATASPSIRKDIVDCLNLKNPQITCTSFDRPNLYLEVGRKTGNIIRDLKQFLIKKDTSTYEFEGPSIVYCPSRKITEQVSAELMKLNLACGTYHAGMGIKERRNIHHKFMRDEIQCIVATVAFGMGINKADIRTVIHYGAPKEMESYYQEIGRAGRDGLPASCHVLWTPADLSFNRHSQNICIVEKEDSFEDFGQQAYKLMSAVCALNERFGMGVPVLFLRGSNSQRVPDRYRTHALFGSGKDWPENLWKALGRSLVLEGFLKEVSGINKFSTICTLSAKGKDWLCKAKENSSPKLLLLMNEDLYLKTPRYNATVQLPLPLAPVSPTVPAVSQREKELQTALYGKLVAARQKLANEKDIPPAVLATNKVLVDMTTIRPTTIESIKRIDGVSEAKSAMLESLLIMIKEFSQTNNLQTDIFKTSGSQDQPNIILQKRSECGTLTESERVTYTLFQEKNMSLRSVCESRSLPLTVVGTHLSQALKADYPVDLERAGLTPEIQEMITKIIQNPPINSDVTQMKAIRTLVPAHVEMYLIRMTVMLLEKQHRNQPLNQQNDPDSQISSQVLGCLQSSAGSSQKKEENIMWIDAKFFSFCVVFHRTSSECKKVLSLKNLDSRQLTL